MTKRPGTPDPIAAWRAMLLAHSKVLRAIEADLEAAGAIPLTWYDVLLELNAADGRLRMQTLGERVVLSRTRVSRLVDEMERRGLVAREPDPDDGRATYAVITGSGKKALRATAPKYRQGIEQHFARYLSDDEQQLVTESLGRVVAAHEPLHRPSPG